MINSRAAHAKKNKAVRRQTKLLSSTALAATGLLAMAAHPAHALDHLATPTGGQVVGGSATISNPQTGTLNINQNTNRVIIDWDSFNIGRDAVTEFFQPGKGSIAVNKVTGAGEDPAMIEGSLKSNGTVMVLDKNGVIFGKHAEINVGGIIASTGDIDEKAFLHGDTKFEFSNFGKGAIVNSGTINVADAGLAAFVSPTIVNDGIINAKLGKVGFGAGSKVTLDLYGDNLITIAVDDKHAAALIKNSGTINAEGGTVVLSAQAAKEAVDEVINMSGVVNVSSATVKGGTIILSGGGQGSVNVSGTLNASGVGGGSIKVNGQNINIAASTDILADAIMDGAGGDVTIKADNDETVSGNIYARGGANGGDGGNVELSAGDALGYDGIVDTSAVNGAAGSLFIDPATAIIQSGSLNGTFGSTYYISADALAYDLYANSKVTVQATNLIDVGATKAQSTIFGSVGAGPIDVSHYNYSIYGITGYTTVYVGPIKVTVPVFGWINHSSVTTGSLALKAATVDFNQNLTLGTGSLNVQAGTINLNSEIYGNNGTTTALLDSSRLASSASIVNVLSNSASINQGIDLVSASSTAGGTVDVSAGTYNEDIVLNKAYVTLEGAQQGVGGTALTRGNGETIITPHSPGILVTANNDTVDGFTINGASNGIWVQNASNAVIENNIVENSTGNSIYLTNSIEAAVENNLVENGASNAHGIAFEQGSNDGAAQYNTVENVGYNGIYSTGGTDMTFTNNTVTDAATNSSVTAHGISIENGSGIIYGNTITNSGGDGILLYKTTAQSIVADNTVSGTSNYGIDVENAADAEILDDVVYKTGNDGIHADNSKGILVQQNTIGANALDVKQGASNINGYGIYVADSDNAWIGDTTKITNSGNKVYGATLDGIKISNEDNANVWNNTVDTTGRVGIYGGSVTNSSIDGNTISNMTLAGYGAISTDFGSNLEITANNIANSVNGVQIHYATGKQFIANNTVDNISGNGIDVRDTSGVGIEDNKIGLGIDGIAGTTDDTTIGGHGIYVSDTTASSPSDFILGNKIANTTGDGISLSNVSGDHGIPQTYDVAYNTLSNIGVDGISIDGGTFVSTYFNTINGAQRNGISITNASNNTVSYNTIDNAGSNGINAYKATAVGINHNSIGTGTGSTINADGIFVSTSDGAIANNTVQNAGNDGIAAKTSSITISGNTIDNITHTGIEAQGNKTVTIQNNKIGLGADGIAGTADDSTIGGQGIFVSGTTAASSADGVFGNTIANTASDGIMLSGVSGDHTIPQTFDVASNTLTNIGGNGISIDGGTFVSTYFNTIDGAKGDGISVSNAPNDFVRFNTIDNVVGNGITGSTAASFDADHNSIGTGTDSTIGNDGIYVIGSNNAGIGANTISHTGYDGIEVDNSNDVLIGGASLAAGNQISQSGFDNIGTYGGDGVQITYNTLASALGASGVALHSTTNSTVADNVITDPNLLGIYAQYADGVSITGNSITGSGQAFTSYNNYGTGIGVEATNGVTITGNHVDSATGDGIDAGAPINLANSNDTKVTIDGNFIGQTAGVLGDGIRVPSGLLSASKNTIDQTTLNGIEVANSANAAVNKNTIGQLLAASIGGDGISISDSDNVTVNKNTISNTGGDGVYVDPSKNAEIAHNVISNVNGDGIDEVNSNGAYIHNNTITGAGQDGIYVSGGKNAVITYNHITGSAPIFGIGVDGAARDGIHVENNKSVDIENNIIQGGGSGSAFTTGGKGAGRDGIYVIGSNNANIIDNKIEAGVAGFLVTDGDGAGQDGIFVSNSKAATIQGNYILGSESFIFNDGGNGADNNGIEVTNSDDTKIVGNFVEGNGNQSAVNNGILVSDSKTATVSGNLVNETGATGIVANNAKNVDIAQNTVYLTGADGIDVDSSANAILSGNFVGQDANGDSQGANNINGNGIFVNASNNASITDNSVSDTTSTAPGIGSGIFVTNSNHAFIGGEGENDGNTITNIAWDGIKLGSDNNVTVENNFVENTTRVGIYGYSLNNSYIANNTVEQAHLAGYGAIHTDFGSDQTIENNNISDSDGDGVGIYFGNGKNVISDNNIDGVAQNGVYVVGTDNIKIDHNEIGQNIAGEGTIGNNGVYVDGATSGFVSHNDIAQTGENGIDLENVNGTADAAFKVHGNNVYDTDEDGILADNSSYLSINGNTINDTTDNGIELDYTSNTKINHNKIGLDGYVGENGIAIYGIPSVTLDAVQAFAEPGFFGGGSNNITIDSNKIANTVDDGIHVTNTTTLEADNNHIKNTDGDGIYGYHLNTADILSNHIQNAGNNGIEVLNSNTININQNIIGRLNVNNNEGEIFAEDLEGNNYSVTNNGIDVEDSNGIDVNANTIRNTGANGVYSFNANDITISNNQINTTGNHGIEVAGNANPGYLLQAGDDGTFETTFFNYNSTDITVNNNTINNAGNDGIDADVVSGLNIHDNTINTANSNGIELNQVANGNVLSNTVDNVSEDGILVSNGNGITVDGNKIGANGYIDGRGIAVTTVDANNGGEDGGGLSFLLSSDIARVIDNNVNSSNSNITISNNTIDAPGQDGVYAENTNGLTVIGNSINTTGGNAITLSNIATGDVSNNIIDGNIAANGIDATGSNSDITINNNTIGAVSQDGIHVEDTNGLTVNGNTVTGATDNGIQISGSDTVRLMNNLITSSGANGLFVSGANNGSVVLTGNTFTDNQTGARFQSGAIDLTGTGANANTFNGGTLGMVFDPGVGGDPSALTLVNLTIGGSVFNGQSNYDIELANNAFYAPGFPTILDGTQASYDGFRPDSVNFLTLDEYNTIEAKIYDYNDNPTLGEFFFGVVPDIDQSDIFRKIAGYRVGGRGFNVTIRSLPNVTTGSTQATSAADLANLQPAAGGNDNGNAAQQAANIEPAAGGNDNNHHTANAACWSDAVAGAHGGTSTSFSFGDSLESQLNTAGGCKSGSI